MCISRQLTFVSAMSVHCVNVHYNLYIVYAYGLEYFTLLTNSCRYFDTNFKHLASILIIFQAQISFLQGEREGNQNMMQYLVKRIKMLENALRQERYVVIAWLL